MTGNKHVKFIEKGPNMSVALREVKPEILMGPVGRCIIDPIEIKKEKPQEVLKKAIEEIK